MEEIWEKWQEAESQDTMCDTVNKNQIEKAKASGRKVCEKLGETSKRKTEEAAEIKPENRGGMTVTPLNFFVKKRSRTLQLGKKYNAKKEIKGIMVDYKIFMTSVCDGFDACHALPWQRLPGWLKIEYYLQTVKLGIEIWESCTFLGGYYIAIVLIRPRRAMGMVARKDKLSYHHK